MIPPLVHQRRPCYECNVLVEFTGAQDKLVNTSRVNLTHLKWVLRKLEGLIRPPLTGLGKNSENPFDVLLVSPYKAQTMEYRKAFQQLRGELSDDQLRRIKIKTLDEAQGDEADLIIADFVLVSHPGFTGADFRVTLATTRARGMNIYLMNRGSFIRRDKKRDNAERAIYLYRAHKFVSDRSAIVRIPSSTYCEDDTHSTNDCPMDEEQRNQRMKDFVCEREQCTQIGHNAATCPDRICRNCNEQGHSANECDEDIICSRCGHTGHMSFDCAQPIANFKCRNCSAVGHNASSCPREFSKRRWKTTVGLPFAGTVTNRVT